MSKRKKTNTIALVIAAIVISVGTPLIVDKPHDETMDRFVVDGLASNVVAGRTATPSYFASPSIMSVSSGLVATESGPVCEAFTYTGFGIGKGFFDEAVFSWTTAEQATTSDVRWRVYGQLPWNDCNGSITFTTSHSTDAQICLTLLANKTYEFQVSGTDECDTEIVWSATTQFTTNASKVPTLD